MVLSTFQSQTKLQKCFLLNIIELGGLKIAINNDMPTKYLYFNQLKFFQEYVLQMRKLRNGKGKFKILVEFSCTGFPN